MEAFDPQKAARVWERVQQGSPERDLPGLIQGEREAAAAYLYLSRRFSGKESVTLRQMAQQEQAHAACLKGIYTLLTGTKPPKERVLPPAGDTAAALRSCYAQEMRSLAAYEKHAADPQYGPVFARLARQEQDHCHLLLELIGK